MYFSFKPTAYYLLLYIYTTMLIVVKPLLPTSANEAHVIDPPLTRNNDSIVTGRPLSIASPHGPLSFYFIFM